MFSLLLTWAPTRLPLQQTPPVAKNYFEDPRKLQLESPKIVPNNHFMCVMILKGMIIFSRDMPLGHRITPIIPEWWTRCIVALGQTESPPHVRVWEFPSSTIQKELIAAQQVYPMPTCWWKSVPLMLTKRSCVAIPAYEKGTWGVYLKRLISHRAWVLQLLHSKTKLGTAAGVVHKRPLGAGGCLLLNKSTDEPKEGHTTSIPDRLQGGDSCFPDANMLTPTEPQNLENIKVHFKVPKMAFWSPRRIAPKRH